MVISKSTWRTIWGIVSLLSLTGATVWSTLQYQTNYHNLEMSNLMFQTLLAKQTSLTLDLQNINKELADEMTVLRQNLESNRDLLAKVEQENLDLKEKVKLLDQLAELEQSVGNLKEKNAIVINQISKAESQSPYREKNLKTLAEAQKLLDEYKERIRLTKSRIHELKVVKNQERVAKQKEDDRLASLAGNNGYLVREGKPFMLGAVLEKDPAVRIDVQFVK